MENRIYNRHAPIRWAFNGILQVYKVFRLYTSWCNIVLYVQTSCDNKKTVEAKYVLCYVFTLVQYLLIRIIL
jgi:hypothetical protein